MVKTTKNFKVKDLGVVDDYVYDIDTSNHMFFGNGVLVHNSNYMDLTDVLNKYYKINKDADRNTATDFLDAFCKKIESDCLNPLFDKMGYECNWHKDVPEMHMDREAISIPYKKTGYSGIWFAKKRYYLCVSDMEDYRYEEPHPKIMGLYSVTSTCPSWIKPYYNQVIQDLIENGVDEARSTVKKFKKEFYKKPLSDIASQTSVSEVNRFVNPRTNLPWEGEWDDKVLGKKRNGGVPANSKAAIHYNYLIDKLGLDKKYARIQNGDKMKWLYLKENPYHFDVIGFIDELPEEFDLHQYVDVEHHLDKAFMTPIKDVFSACNLTVEKQLTMDDFF